MKIIDTAQAMPPSGHFVLAWLEGSKIPMRALWADKFSLGVSAEQDPEWGEYCEEKDEYFCPAGWYEMNQHEESHWRVDGSVVAWCELPRLEAGAAPAVVAPQGVKFFSASNEGLDEHDTAEAAQSEAQSIIDMYREEAADGWPEEVDSVCWGVILGKAVERPVKDAPHMAGILGSDMEPVDYVLEPVAAPALEAPAAPEPVRESDVLDMIGMVESGQAEEHHLLHFLKRLASENRPVVLAAAPQAPAAPVEPVEAAGKAHDWRENASYGGEICAECGAAKGSRRGNAPCSWPPAKTAKRWPFVESPGEFTARLEAAIRSFGALLPAVRNVLIENPPTLLAAPAAPAVDAWLQPDDMAALQRFHETAEDDESYDIGKEAVARLCAFGCLQSHSFGRYSTTDFGDYLLGACANARRLPFATAAELAAQAAAKGENES